MMGPKQEVQGALFYEFSKKDHVPRNNLLRSIDRFIDLSDTRQHLASQQYAIEQEPLLKAFASSVGVRSQLLSHLEGQLSLHYQQSLSEKV